MALIHTIIEEKLHDDFVARFREKSKTAFVPGDPLDPKTSMGPLVTREQQERVLGYISAGKEEGANLAFGGAVPEGLEAGCYVAPTLFTGVNNQMKIAREEIFGPVAAVLPFKDLAQAIEIANDTSYGLAASIWTSNVNVAHKAARDIEAREELCIDYRHLLGEGQRETFDDAASGTPILGWSWQESLSRSTQALARLFPA